MACNYVLIETYSKADKTLLMNRSKTETAHMSSYEPFLFKKIASDKSQNKLYWSPKDHLWHCENGSWIIQHNYCHSEKKQSGNESSACGRFVNIHMSTWHLELWHLELFWHWAFFGNEDRTVGVAFVRESGTNGSIINQYFHDDILRNHQPGCIVGYTEFYTTLLQTNLELLFIYFYHTFT